MHYNSSEWLIFLMHNAFTPIFLTSNEPGTPSIFQSKVISRYIGFLCNKKLKMCKYLWGYFSQNITYYKI